ncbi:hypothetical protein D9757_005154 [Collybiopsis confluens]|uniref:DUF1776-domain-containing protein n=1 Tax=Collybiopsis confluens TaxID=2823264 RepID=A0A8H5HSY7_9AGAR|nr:hypothetical protein D9757_005154 [Collybiopsis confluens]
MGTMEKLEEYRAAVEEYVFYSLSAATPESFRESVNQLWADFARYGPGMPTMHDVTSRIGLPDLGDFEIPPPPPPPPPPKSWAENCYDWVEKHPWMGGSIAVGAIGTGLLVGYGGIYMRARRARRFNSKAGSSERRQVIVVLGGDHPLGLPIILDLEAKGYIVITSVATANAAVFLEGKCHGFVRALMLDPNRPETVPQFLRSLASTMSRRFPTTAAGDPYVSPATHPYIQSIVSLLTLPPSSLQAPLEHISFSHTYLPYLTATQVTPLQIIQSLLPLLRNVHVPNRRDDKKSIVVCLPATETFMGLPFSAIQSMSAIGTLRAVEILRREINVASITGKSEMMKNVKVVEVNVGSFDLGGISSSPQDVYKAMEKWTASEKITYGPAFANIMAQGHSASTIATARTPTDVRVFVDTILGVVSNGKHGYSPLVQRLGLGRLLSWLRRDRVSIGAGGELAFQFSRKSEVFDFFAAKTYRIAASLLPSVVLNILLNVPASLISLRNSLLTTQPFLRPPNAAAGGPLSQSLGIDPVPARDSGISATNTQHPAARGGALSGSTPASRPESSAENSETSEAEADIESNAGDVGDRMVESSWISLPPKGAHAEQTV